MKTTAKILIEKMSLPETGAYNLSIHYRSTLTDNIIIEFIDICFSEKNSGDNIAISLSIPFSSEKLLNQKGVNTQNKSLNSILDIIKEHFVEVVPLMIDGNYQELAGKIEIWLNCNKYNL